MPETLKLSKVFLYLCRSLGQCMIQALAYASMLAKQLVSVNHAQYQY